MIGLGYSPFQPFWPLFLHHALLAGGGFTLYPHAFTAPWLEVVSAGGVLFGMPELAAAGVMLRSPAGGGMLTVYGPDFFRIVHLRAGIPSGMRWGPGLDLRVVQIKGRPPAYSAMVALSGEIPFPRGVLLWALDTDGQESQAWGTFWISEGPARMALDGTWRPGEFLGALAFLMRVQPQVELGVAFHTSRATGWLFRVVPREGMVLTLSAKVHPELPVSTGAGVAFREGGV